MKLFKVGYTERYIEKTGGSWSETLPPKTINVLAEDAMEGIQKAKDGREPIDRTPADGYEFQFTLYFVEILGEVHVG